MNRRGERFQQFNADPAHQRLAGKASWCALSARWRAHQGLPLLHPMDVQFLTPQDFCNGQGLPLHPTEQRRLFRFYVEAALRLAHEHEQRGRVIGGVRLVRVVTWRLCGQMGLYVCCICALIMCTVGVRMLGRMSRKRWLRLVPMGYLPHL
jgi:hypothetical protein